MIWTIVVAAGSGSRYGGPKQFDMLGGRPLVQWAVDAARDASDGVVVVLPADALDREPAGASSCVAGGATRSASVRAGLAAVPEDATVIVVHDAARPLAGADVFGRVIAAVENGADAAVPVVDVVDSLRRREGGAIDRAGVVVVQTPQAFRSDALRSAHAEEPESTDDASLVEAAGGAVVLVEGHRRALKITDADDLRVAEALLSR